MDYFVKNVPTTIHSPGGFWGHLGILVQGQPKYLWFPITAYTRQLVYKNSTEKYMAIPCMDNSLLLINCDKIEELVLLDEACGSPVDMEWDSHPSHSTRSAHRMSSRGFQGPMCDQYRRDPVLDLHQRDERTGHNKRRGCDLHRKPKSDAPRRGQPWRRRHRNRPFVGIPGVLIHRNMATDVWHQSETSNKPGDET
jgi:hypothetical protein